MGNPTIPVIIFSTMLELFIGERSIIFAKFARTRPTEKVTLLNTIFSMRECLMVRVSVGRGGVGYKVVGTKVNFM